MPRQGLHKLDPAQKQRLIQAIKDKLEECNHQLPQGFRQAMADRFGITQMAVGQLASKLRPEARKYQGWWVYLARCRDDSLYCGMAIDVEARIKKHNKRNGAKCLLGKLPVNLVWCEMIGSKSAALKREVAIKKLSKKDKENLVLSNPYGGYV